MSMRLSPGQQGKDSSETLFNTLPNFTCLFPFPHTAGCEGNACEDPDSSQTRTSTRNGGVLRQTVRGPESCREPRCPTLQVACQPRPMQA